MAKQLNGLTREAGVPTGDGTQILGTVQLDLQAYSNGYKLEEVLKEFLLQCLTRILFLLVVASLVVEVDQCKPMIDHSSMSNILESWK